MGVAAGYAARPLELGRLADAPARLRGRGSDERRSRRRSRACARRRTARQAPRRNRPRRGRCVQSGDTRSAAACSSPEASAGRVAIPCTRPRAAAQVAAGRPATIGTCCRSTCHDLRGHIRSASPLLRPCATLRRPSRRRTGWSGRASSRSPRGPAPTRPRERTRTADPLTHGVALSAPVETT